MNEDYDDYYETDSVINDILGPANVGAKQLQLYEDWYGRYFTRDNGDLHVVETIDIERLLDSMGIEQKYWHARIKEMRAHAIRISPKTVNRYQIGCQDGKDGTSRC